MVRSPAESTALSAVLHRSLTGSLPEATSGEGSCLFDSHGRRYLDASGGAVVSNLGHRHPDVVGAVFRQIRRLEFWPTFFFYERPRGDSCAAIDRSGAA